MNSPHIATLVLILLVVNSGFCQRDSTVIVPENNVSLPTRFTHSDYFQSLSGGMNAVHQNNQARMGFDMAVQTCHYFLVTGRRIKNDSIHKTRVKQDASLVDLYSGFHFYLLNRAAVHFDSIKSMTSNYVNSLAPSPLTLRLKKDIFLTRNEAITTSNFAPVVSIEILTDFRAIPFLDRANKLKVGASGHLYVSLSTQFKRIQFDPEGKKIDQGVIYFKPSFGIAYGTNEMMERVLTTENNEPIYSTQMRLGFQSDRKAVKDFSFLLNYSISDLLGPKILMGVVLTALGN
ncbi:MAG: hypothetical protein QNK23_08130 [Crocinitomicaceae bacterium]|nr:hypothetical protein [Crocinitomicaceae bacterium]